MLIILQIQLFNAKLAKTHHFPINYLHMIQLATELDTVVAKSAAQYPSSLCCITQNGVPQSRACNTYSPQMAPALLKITFYSHLWSLLTPNTSMCIIIFWIIIIYHDYFVYTNTFITSDAE